MKMCARAGGPVRPDWLFSAERALNVLMLSSRQETVTIGRLPIASFKDNRYGCGSGLHST